MYTVNIPTVDRPHGKTVMGYIFWRIPQLAVYTTEILFYCLLGVKKATYHLLRGSQKQPGDILWRKKNPRPTNQPTTQPTNQHT